LAENTINEKNNNTRDVLIIFVRLCLIKNKNTAINVNVKKILNTDVSVETLKALVGLLKVKVLEISKKVFWNAKVLTRALVAAVQKRNVKKHCIFLPKRK